MAPMAPRAGVRFLRLVAVLLGGGCFVAPQLKAFRGRGENDTLIPRPAGTVEVPGGLKNGVKMVMDEQPFMLMSHQSKKQGKGVAITKAKLKNLLTGAIIEKTLSSGARFPEVETVWEVGTFSYRDDDDGSYHVMDMETFEQHGGMVKEFESMYGVNAELFDTADEMYMNTEEFPPRELMEYFKTPDVKKTLRTVLLHFADISNPMKPFPVAERWAELVLKEFALQGEEEKALGIPVGPLNDKKTVSLPLSQIGFIEFVVAPLALAMARVLPPVWFTNQMIIDNANIWMDKWIEDTLLKPSLEEQVQVRERIHRMVQKTEQRGFTATLAQMEN